MNDFFVRWRHPDRSDEVVVEYLSAIFSILSQAKRPYKILNQYLRHTSPPYLLGDIHIHMFMYMYRYVYIHTYVHV